jgi:hypothetical protein
MLEDGGTRPGTHVACLCSRSNEFIEEVRPPKEVVILAGRSNLQQPPHIVATGLDALIHGISVPDKHTLCISDANSWQTDLLREPTLFGQTQRLIWRGD